MALSETKAFIAELIEKDIKRGEVVGGVYSSATFTIGRNKFVIVADYYQNGKRVGSAIFKNGKLYRGSVVSNGRYRDYSLGGGMDLMEHQLLAIALIPGATKALIDETSYNVINHKVIYLESIKAREAYKKNGEYYVDLMMKYRLNEYDKSKYYDKAFQPPCDVRELEICTSAQNYAHGALIRTFDLYGVPISAHDVPLLKVFLTDKERVKRVIEMYLEFGAEGMEEVL